MKTRSLAKPGTYQGSQLLTETPTVLTGNETAFGTAVNNTQTDDFIVSGSGNTIVEGAGNLTVNGSDPPSLPYDTATTIILQSAYQTTDTINLNGGQNAIDGSGALYQSTVDIAVTGAGSTPGGNTVALENDFGSTTVSLVGGGNSVGLAGDSTTKITIAGGGNSVSVNAAYGATTTIGITGGGNTIGMNGDATNTIKIAQGGSDVINVGFSDDGDFGFATKLTLSGGKDTITGGDENFVITGAVAHNKITVDDGNDTILLKGGANNVTVWGGVDTITTGALSTINILGIDGANDTSFTYDPSDPGVTLPTDTVNITGNKDAVNATYENVVINGLAAGLAKISLGNGNNQVTLGGNSNTVGVGDGTNNIFLGGNGSTVTVTDAAGIGTDNISLGNGSGDVLSFAYAGGSVYGTGTGSTTVTQNTASGRELNVNLNNGTGLVTLGQGNDTVTANGGGSVITAGNGTDTVYANGDGSAVTLGNGNDFVYANGSAASVTLGGGNDFVQANGDGAVVTAGSGNDNVSANGVGAVVTLGSGNDNVSATGSLSTVTLTGGAGTASTITVGDNNSYVWVQNGGNDQISGGAGDTFYLNALQAGSNVDVSGNSNMVFLGSDSTATVDLNHASIGDILSVQADAGGTYGGALDVVNFTLNDQIDLQGLVGGISPVSLSNYADVLANMTGGPFGATLHLAGGGSILFSAETGFTSSQFIYSGSTGPVHP